MCANTTAQLLIESMVQGADEDFKAGDLPKAIETSTNFIQAIVTNDEQTRNTLGQVLVPLYCLRAQSLLLLGEQNGDPGLVERARGDVAKALEALEAYYEELEAEHRAALRENIHQAIADDSKTRQTALAAILQAKLSVRTITSRADKSTRDVARERTSFSDKVAHFLLGSVLWAVSAAIVYAGVESGSDNEIAQVLMIIPLILVFALAMKGWGWYSQYKMGTIGHFTKFFVMLMLAMTIVGLLPMFYWSGRGTAMLVWKNA